MTGINAVFFFAIHNALLTKGRLCDTEALASELQLLLLLNWLHEMPKLSTLSQTFSITKSITSTTIKGLIYNLHEVLQELVPILLPAQWDKHKFEGVVGAVDCTSHYHCHIHLGQANFYCSDKRGHFLTAQIYDVVLGCGHNNDSGMAILTGLKEGLLQQQVKVLADGGYGAMYAVTPTDKDDANWHAEHAARRSVVERVNSRTASFAASCINTGKFRGSPELQTVALLCIYHLVQHSLATAPLYANRSGPAQWRWSHDGDLKLDSDAATDGDSAESDAGVTESESDGDAKEDDDSLLAPIAGISF